MPKARPRNPKTRRPPKCPVCGAHVLDPYLGIREIHNVATCRGIRRQLRSGASS